ncbi:hypothetical protein MJO28_005286 [Puccinia striiformis f. sp. tritici]|uniref:Uncharacterized protein n=1 Tax=Puccinia striiformis f. sp. tritici TaxID=168172 RepID=A0ACC0EJV5_9BASI|nr:hypothetical protein MJO28_005286 [Puccinia striiformis f. sp. tritici]
MLEIQDLTRQQGQAPVIKPAVLYPPVNDSSKFHSGTGSFLFTDPAQLFRIDFDSDEESPSPAQDPSSDHMPTAPCPPVPTAHDLFPEAAAGQPAVNVPVPANKRKTNAKKGKAVEETTRAASATADEM